LSPKIYEVCFKKIAHLKYCFILMEKADGTLARYLLKPHPLSEIKSIAHQMDNIVSELLGFNIQNNDLRLNNFVYTKLPNGKIKVMLIDFGNSTGPYFAEETDLVLLIARLSDNSRIYPQVIYILDYLYNKFKEVFSDDLNEFIQENYPKTLWPQINEVLKHPGSKEFSRIFSAKRKIGWQSHPALCVGTKFRIFFTYYHYLTPEED